MRANEVLLIALVALVVLAGIFVYTVFDNDSAPSYASQISFSLPISDRGAETAIYSAGSEAN